MGATVTTTIPMSLGRSLIQAHSLSLADGITYLKRRFNYEELSRFQCALLASLLVHAIVLFGITIRPLDRLKPDNISSSLEVILVNAKSTTAPAETKVYAQHNLDGGGNTDADRRAKSPLPVTRAETQSQELTAESRRVQQLEQEAKQLLTQVNSQANVASGSTQPQPQAETRPAPNAADIMRKSMEMARLEAEISKSLDDYSKRPRRRFLGPNTQEYRFTRYIEDWRLKIERIGTVNYPQAARDQKIYGSLRLTVSIKSDGTVEKIEIDRSSGKKILDDAAVRIVNLAAPYAPFPSNIAQDTDILSITKTWTFTSADQLQTE